MLHRNDNDDGYDSHPQNNQQILPQNGRTVVIVGNQRRVLVSPTPPSGSNSSTTPSYSTSSSSSCRCSVCGCSCCDTSSYTSSSSTGTNTSSTTDTSSSTSTTPNIHHRGGGNNSKHKCPACFGTGFSLFTGQACTACRDGLSPSSTSSSSSASPAAGHQSRNAAAAATTTLSATRTARGDWICEECRVSEMRMRSQYNFVTPRRNFFDAAGGQQQPAASASKLLAATPLLRVTKPEHVPPAAAPSATSAGATATVVSSQAQQPQQQQQAHQAQEQLTQQQAQQQEQQQQIKPQTQQQVPEQARQEEKPQQQQQQEQSQPSGTQDKAQQEEPAKDQAAASQTQQQQLTEGFLNEYFNNAAAATNVVPAAAARPTVIVHIRDAHTQTKPKYFRRTAAGLLIIPSSDNDDNDDDDLFASARYQRSIGVQIPNDFLTNNEDGSVEQQQQPRIRHQTAQTETAATVTFTHCEVQLDGETELPPSRRRAEMQRTAAVEADTITPHLVLADLRRIERCQLEEAEQRQQLQSLALELLAGVHSTALELIRNVRFLRDSSASKLLQHREAAEVASVQQLLLAETCVRQQIDRSWLSSFVTSISQPFHKEHALLSLSDLQQQSDEKDKEIEALKKKLECEAVAAAAREHTLRDRLRAALLYGEKASVSTTVTVNPVTASVSLVDLNLPIEVRFARAHAIAVKALRLEQTGSADLPQEEEELEEARRSGGVAAI